MKKNREVISLEEIILSFKEYLVDKKLPEEIARIKD